MGDIEDILRIFKLICLFWKRVKCITDDDNRVVKILFCEINKTANLIIVSVLNALDVSL